MRITYQPNYSGYMPVLRCILLLIKAGVLSLSQLGPYMLFVMQADFDPRHRNYRAVLRDDKQLARAAGVNPTTIYRHRKELIKAGLLIEEDGITKVTNFHAFELEWVKSNAKIAASNPEEVFLTPQENLADVKASNANLQDKQGQFATQRSHSIVSIKGETFSDPFRINGEEE